MSGTLPGRTFRSPCRRTIRPAAILALALGGFCLGAGVLPAQQVTERYDPTFRKYTKRYFGAGFDWRLFKAQGMAESNLNPDAHSWVGARGIMQLMPSTFLDIQTRNPTWTAIDNIEWNIAAGIGYDRRLWLQWHRDSVDSEDHRYFMVGSYNAGRIPILRAQSIARRKALDPRYWASIEMVAAEVKGWRHQETLAYVRRIRDHLSRMDQRGRFFRGIADSIR